jgi:hypothetical protein
LPLAAEFPMTLPGYCNQEISAHRFMQLGAACVPPLSAEHRWQLRLGVASAYLDKKVWRVFLRYGYGFNALRDGRDGAHSVSVLYPYNIEQREPRHATAKRISYGD